MGDCTERRRKREAKVVSTNPVYRCEELEDPFSAYDEIEENHSDDFDEEKLYPEVLSTEPEGCHQGSEPQSPGPKPVTTSEDQKQENDYGVLKEQEPDHAQIHMPNDDTKGDDQDSKAED